MKKYVLLMTVLLVGLGALAGYEAYQNRSLKASVHQLEQSAFESRQELIKQSQELQQKSANFSSNQNVNESQIHSLEEALKQEMDSANMLAYQHSITILEALATQNIAKINEFTGNKPVGVYMNDTKQFNTSIKLDSNEDIIQKLFSWVSQNQVKNPEYTFLPGHGVLHQAYGAYHNIALKLKDGYLWVQLDNEARLVKLVASKDMPVPE